jgi:hypothetical protein
MNDWLKFVMAVLATWRVTHLVVREDGPWKVVARLRRLAGDGFFGGLMDCFYCASLWVAAPAALAVAPDVRHWVLAWLALSGAACLLDRLGSSPVMLERIANLQGGPEDGLLRTESRDSTSNTHPSEAR